MLRIVTDEQYRRVDQAYSDTKRIIAKERGYSEEFQNKGLLSDYEAHAVKLETMMRNYEIFKNGHMGAL